MIFTGFNNKIELTSDWIFLDFFHSAQNRTSPTKIQPLDLKHGKTNSPTFNHGKTWKNSTIRSEMVREKPKTKMPSTFPLNTRA